MIAAAASTPRSGEPAVSNRRSLMANTFIMSLRTFLTMALSLYSSRIVLAELGIVDYGIYFAVAGITLVVSFLNSALSTSTQRFLSVEMASGDRDRLRSVFGASLQIHALFALITLVVCETLGVWLLETKMVIPEARMGAATVAFHLAVLSTATTIILVPFNAALVASERFTAYAVFDALHAALRLAVALALVVASGDLLELFAALMFAVTLCVGLGRILYCGILVPFSRFRICRDRGMLRDMVGFAGWSLLGAASLVLNIQGVGIVLNMFFGPVANAAQNIAVQLNNATSTLAANLQITASPQIVKAHASGRMEEFHSLVAHSAKLSFLLMLVLTAPIIAGMDAILDIWLETVPAHASDIGRLLLMTALVNSLSFPLMAAAQASGTIRLYQTVVSGLGLCVLPAGYLAFSQGAGLLVIFQMLLGLSVLTLAVRLAILRRLVGLDVGHFLRLVIGPSAGVGAISLSACWAAAEMVPDTIVPSLAAALLVGAVTLAAGFRLGLSASERRDMLSLFGSRFKSIGRLA